MPQTLKNHGSHVTYNLGAALDHPTVTHPRHCQYAIAVIAGWGLIESYIVSVFINLLGANASAFASVAATIRSQQWQQIAIKAAASDVFKDDEEMRDLISSVLEICEDAGSARNRLVHWVWGNSPELPDAILLANPVAIAAHEARQKSANAEMFTNATPSIHSEIDRGEIYAYTLDDLEEAVRRQDRARQLLIRLKMLLSLGAQSDPMFAQTVALGRGHLLDEPEIRRAMGREQKRRERQRAPQESDRAQ